MALLISQGSAVWLSPRVSTVARPIACAWRASCRLQAAGADGVESPEAPTTMKLKDVKAELDARDVAWRGVCFERAELEQALVAAREAGTTERAPAATPSHPDATLPDAETSMPVAAEEAPGPVGSMAPAGAKAYDDAYAAAYERVIGLKVKDLRSELASRGTGWADLFEKEELAARLAALCARAALFSASGALEPGKAGKLSAAQLRQELADTRTPMLLDVYATWCALFLAFGFRGQGARARRQTVALTRLQA
jgi:hypothetical protein